MADMNSTDPMERTRRKVIVKKTSRGRCVFYLSFFSIKTTIKTHTRDIILDRSIYLPNQLVDLTPDDEIRNVLLKSINLLDKMRNCSTDSEVGYFKRNN